MSFHKTFEKIKEDNIMSRKSKNLPMSIITAELIDKFQESIKLDKQTTLHGAMVIRKVKSEHVETLRFFGDVGNSVEEYAIEYCDRFLPKEITDRTVILSQIEIVSNTIEEPISMKHMGKIITDVKELSNGAIDSKLLSTVVREFIQGGK